MQTSPAAADTPDIEDASGRVVGTTTVAPAGGSTTVQAVERTVALLEAMADAGGQATLSSLALRSGLPMPTIHRLMRTLVGCGYVRQGPGREYSLGPRLVRLGDSAGRLVGMWARPRLVELVDALGESANLAVLDGTQVVYIAQEPGRHAMRMFTEVGRRVPPHCTAVGKALLALMPAEQVQELLRHTEMTAQTESTIIDPAAFAAELERIRRCGYALDDGEQELGVRCVAVALDAPVLVAVSVSGPSTRMTDDLVAAAVPRLRSAARALLDGMARNAASPA
ncbi:IclR family transcriptional regulator [Pseudonocardia parietis]|uniref:IclR family acetate operon transcriptional repressor n=1 Tax=Pseudonocardia parietis TaxID=570936 RepID=A0ABS4VVQ0_9PSEU|nr:IclR family transcriptional regulator [Pseudonocardia parietis]MBP2367986.1 IclR family acetate operon transcriptional repressor [Pseudonocardia parietis]